MTATTIEPGRFACPQCSRRFETLGDKKRHIRSEHPTLKDLEREQRDYEERH